MSGEKEQDGLKCPAMVHPEVLCQPTPGLPMAGTGRHVHQWGRSIQLSIKPCTYPFLISLLEMLIFMTLKRTT